MLRHIVLVFMSCRVAGTGAHVVPTLHTCVCAFCALWDKRRAADRSYHDNVEQGVWSKTLALSIQKMKQRLAKGTKCATGDVSSDAETSVKC